MKLDLLEDGSPDGRLLRLYEFTAARAHELQGAFEAFTAWPLVI